MKLNLKDFTGTLQAPYKIEIISDKSLAGVSLSVKPHFSKEYVTLDTVYHILEATYRENLRAALKEAESRWNLVLIKEQIENLITPV
jgi:hypothetical protein